MVGVASLGACALVAVACRPFVPGVGSVNHEWSLHRNAVRPNILVVITDDQRAVGTFAVMPNVVAWFGRGGTRFTQAFVPSPLCCPSRASLFTGRYTHNHDVLNNRDTGLLDQSTTIQRDLQRAGYQTGISGKYLNHWPPRARPPFFDRWAISLKGNEYFDRKFNVDGQVRTVHGYDTDFVASQALTMLQSFEDQDEDPWFLYVAPGAPHAPYTAARRYKDAEVPNWNQAPERAEPDRTDKPSYVNSGNYFGYTRADIVRRKQLRTLISVDDLVGRLERALQRMGETRQTLAIFMSDNGFLWGEHGLRGKGPPYTESVRVPLLVRWPGHVPAGAIDDRLVSSIDLAPTIAAAAGLNANQWRVDGRSLFSPRGHRRVLIEYSANPDTEIPTWAANRTPEYHYVEYYRPNGGLLAREYYDLINDPFEQRNLLGDASAANDPPVGRLSRQLRRDKACRGRSCP